MSCSVWCPIVHVLCLAHQLSIASCVLFAGLASTQWLSRFISSIYVFTNASFFGRIWASVVVRVKRTLEVHDSGNTRFQPASPEVLEARLELMLFLLHVQRRKKRLRPEVVSAARTLVTILNGADWRSPSLVHICSPSCE